LDAQNLQIPGTCRDGPFAERELTELQATGESVRRHTVETPDDLTARD
jgi:hypothetical protein